MQACHAPSRDPFRRGLAALVLAAAAALPAGAQIPTEFTNLKVLPKDIDRGELVGTMRDFAGALGVRCTFCHLGDDPDTLEGVDFASDERETKRIARVMMRMVDEINTELLPRTGAESPRRISCVTCHHGLEQPETLEQALSAAIEKDGVAGAAARYRELREEYYGRGAYDFSYRTLNRLAEDLARDGEIDGALALVELNLEFHPEVANVYLRKGQIHLHQGDRAAAAAAFGKALEIEPGNAFARQMLDRVKPPEGRSE